MSDDGLTHLQLGALHLDFPNKWEQELDMVIRAPEIDGYCPNIRLTVRRGAEKAAVQDLAKRYHSLLSEGMQGEVLKDKAKDTPVLGADEAQDLSFTIQLEGGRSAKHRVLIVSKDGLIVTAGASHRTDDDDATIRKSLEKVLSSLRIKAER